ncbi:MAG: D-glycero-beta-D-manno-heptose-7-phosphate kinase [bacterium]
MKDQHILQQFPGKVVLVIGDIILDEYIWGDVNRISPEAPVPVVEINHRSYVPGGAANTAANICGLQGNGYVCGVVGDDPQAELLRDVLREHRVMVEGAITDPSRPTTTKTRIVAQNQQMVRVDYERTHSLSLEVQERLLQWVQRQMDFVDSCILSDYEKGVVSPEFAQKVIQMARAAGKPVVVDPKGRDFSKYRGATIIKPNLQEAEQAINQKIYSEESLLQAGRELMSIVGDSTVLITRGAQGMSIFQKERPVVHIPALTRNVFDVTGAGDTVVSVLAMALASGASTEEAARLANRAAGIVVGKIGTATVKLEELREAE